MKKACRYLKKKIRYIYLILILILLVLFRVLITNLWMKCIGYPLFSGIGSSCKNDILVISFFLTSFLPLLFWVKNRTLSFKLRVIPQTCLISITIIYIWFRSTSTKLFIPFNFSVNIFYADTLAFFCFIISLIVSFSTKTRHAIIDCQIKNSLLKTYFSSDLVDYAIMINGPWGTGKSFYWRYTLKPELEKVGYKTIYVSLFGLSDVSELRSRIQEQLHPFAKHPISRAVGSIGNSILGLLGIKWGTEDTDNVVDSLSVEWNRIVLCFDDIERAPEGKLLDMLGYINSFIEQHNCHVLLISDDKKIKKEDYESYTNYKEKLVRFTIQPETDFENSFDKIFSDYSNQFYIPSSISEFIRDIFVAANCENLRSVILCLDVLKQCWPVLKDEELQKLPFIVDVHKHVAYLAAVYTIVYQQYGKEELLQSIMDISEPESYDFDSEQSMVGDLSDGNSSSKTQDEKENINSIKDRFREHVPSGKYGRSNAIYKFITTGNFDRELFRQEIDSVIDQLDVRLENPSERSILLRLNNPWIMKDEELQNIVEIAIESAAEGKYDFAYYPEIFSGIINLNKRLFVTVQKSDSELKEIFSSGLNKTSNRTYKKDIESYLSRVIETPECIDLAKKVREMNNQIHKDEVLSDFSKILSAPDRWNKLNDFSDSPFPLYSSIKPKTIFDFLIISDWENQKRWYNSVQQRLDLNSFQTEEKPFFEEIKKLADKWIKEHENSITKAFCRLVSILSGKVIDSFNDQ